MSRISHGRGGAANIGPDDTIYADGGIVREGAVGDQGDGLYSAGRGGKGNILGESTPIGSPRIAPHDEEVVPETATRLAKDESRHVGRGGAGNEFHAHKKEKEEKEEVKSVNQHGFDKKITHESTTEKIKDKLTGLFNKDK